MSTAKSLRHIEKGMDGMFAHCMLSACLTEEKARQQPAIYRQNMVGVGGGRERRDRGLGRQRA